MNIYLTNFIELACVVRVIPDSRITKSDRLHDVSWPGTMANQQ